MMAIEKGALEALLQNLQLTDVKVIKNSLQALNEILKHGENLKSRTNGINPFTKRVMESGFLQVLENLQAHPSEDIYLLFTEIAHKFF